MKLDRVLLQPGTFLLLLAVLTLAQILLARYAKRWQGMLLPFVYELFSARQALGALRYSATGPRYSPDYYRFSMLFFSGVVLALVYYTAWYIWHLQGSKRR